MKRKKRWISMIGKTEEEKTIETQETSDSKEEKEEKKMGFISRHKKGLLIGGGLAAAAGLAALIFGKGKDEDDVDDEDFDDFEDDEDEDEDDDSEE